MPKIGRNDPCPCGSGRKAKACCLGNGPDDVAFVLASQATPMAKLAARWLSAARRRFERGEELDSLGHQRAVQFLHVCRSWNPEAYDETGNPCGDLEALAAAFSGSAAAVYGALAVAFAHLLLDQHARARRWLLTLKADASPRAQAHLDASGLPAAPLEGVVRSALCWADDLPGAPQETP